MKLQTKWTKNHRFTVVNEDDYAVDLDGKIDKGGENTAQTPAELLVSALGGCMGMSMMASLEKYDEPVESLTIDMDAVKGEGVPNRIEKVHMTINIKTDIPKDRVERIARLSKEKYCTVSNSINAETSYELNYQ